MNLHLTSYHCPKYPLRALFPLQQMMMFTRLTSRIPLCIFSWRIWREREEMVPGQRVRREVIRGRWCAEPGSFLVIFVRSSPSPSIHLFVLYLHFPYKSRSPLSILIPPFALSFLISFHTSPSIRACFSFSLTNSFVIAD
jgi:hypothetical protein